MSSTRRSYSAFDPSAHATFAGSGQRGDLIHPLLDLTREAHGRRPPGERHHVRIPAGPRPGSGAYREILTARRAPVNDRMCPGQARSTRALRRASASRTIRARSRRGKGLDQVAEGAAAQRLVEGGERGEGGDHHDLDPLVEGLDVLERVEPAHAGQELDIEEHEVRLEARAAPRSPPPRSPRSRSGTRDRAGRAGSCARLPRRRPAGRAAFSASRAGFGHWESSARRQSIRIGAATRVPVRARPGNPLKLARIRRSLTRSARREADKNWRRDPHRTEASSDDGPVAVRSAASRRRGAAVARSR